MKTGQLSMILVLWCRRKYGSFPRRVQLSALTFLLPQQWYYVPDYSKDKPKPKINDDGELEDEDGNESEEDEVEKAKRLEESRRLTTDENLSRAYKYGSDLIPISKEEEQDFYTFPAGADGLMVRGFIKTADVSQPLYPYAQA